MGTTVHTYLASFSGRKLCQWTGEAGENDQSSDLRISKGGGSLSTGSPAGQVVMVCIGPGSMYSQAYISTGGSSTSIAPCDRVDWKLKLGKQGGGIALFSILEWLPALTAPCKEELCRCVLWGMRWTQVSPAGETLQKVKGSKHCIWPSRCHCHSLSLAPEIQIGFTFLVLPFWYRLTLVIPDKSRRAITWL